jgi:hypothetical protein
MREAWILAPWTVRVSIALVVLAVAVGAVAGLFDQVSQDVILTLLSWSIGLAVVLWFMSRLLRGHNWARIVLTVLVAIGVLASVLDVLRGLYGFTPVTYALNVPNVLAVVLLWLPRSRVWFRAAANSG